jgi:hypothetical protein
MKKGILLLILLGILIPALAAAQFRSDQQRSVFKPSDLIRKPTGLFDKLIHSPRFHMSHSYSLSFFSAGGESFNQGLYLNSMSYQISDPLLAQIQIGYYHQPLGNMGNSGQSGSGLFIRSASLEYKPSDQTKIYFGFESVPDYGLSPYSRQW